ncbi:MAG: iron ABC transporter permease [Candidatus Methanomethylophilus sp.]|nr:iron ABC transporter permease [Methanomethylophilus sp.]MCI2074500.1 iron ABC transporter permease [Methanomethylophilus sp.]MCI2093787.1 iron ABC transporter permease [Methanomethylophilus sp.]
MVNAGVAEYRRRTRIRVLATVMIAAAAVIIGAYSICISQYAVSFSEALDVIAKNLSGGTFDTYHDRLVNHIVWEGYLPIGIAGLLIGAILALGGAVMQTIVRNPVADAYTTGISSGALFGVTLFIVLDFQIAGSSKDAGMILTAFVFSMIPVAIIVLFAFFKKVISTVMVLIGIAVMYIFSSMSTLLRYTASEEDIASIYSWTVGTLAGIGWNAIPWLLAAFVSAFAVLMVISPKINVLESGDRMCTALGENPFRIRIICLVVTSIATSVAVCYSGTIGFVGLVCPHIARAITGSNNRLLIPCSAAIGALVLIAAETASRMVGSTGVSVGVITSLIGGPLFLYFLLRQRKSEW